MLVEARPVTCGHPQVRHGRPRVTSHGLGRARSGHAPALVLLLALLSAPSCAQAPAEQAEEDGVTIEVAGPGHVTLLPVGVDCRESCTLPAGGHVLTAIAVPGRGARFDAWGAACAGTPGCRVRADPGARVTATFAPISDPTFVVDESHPDASDANAGSPEAPWRTIRRAADEAGPGDVVAVRAGTYGGFCVQRGGTARAPVVFRAGGHAVVRGTARCGDSFSVPDVINVEGADHVVIEGFHVREGDRAGIRVVEAEGVMVRHNTVGPNGRWGIFTGFAPHVRILENVVTGSQREHGIYVSNSRQPLDAPLIRANDVSGNAGTGIQLNGDCHAGGDGRIDAALVEANRLYHNQSKSLSVISVVGALIRNNLIHDNAHRSGAGGIHLTNEPGCPERNATRDTTLVNDTIVEPRMAGIRISDAASSNVVFNELVVSSRPVVDEVGGNQVDAGSNLVRASVEDLFADAPAGDFRLHAASPAVAAGRDAYRGVSAPDLDIAGSVRPAGRAVDVGAYSLAPMR